jgi:hypothetical protein
MTWCAVVFCGSTLGANASAQEKKKAQDALAR